MESNTIEQYQQLFASSGYEPELTLGLRDGKRLYLHNLPPFLRTLLTTDGTVTKSIESFYWESVKVSNVYQHFTVADEATSQDLNVALHDRVLKRSVDLIGEQSKVLYVSANSEFAIDRLPEHIRLDLEGMKIGIGEILRECGLETYRKILQLKFDEKVERIYREYLIYINQHPTIKIEEAFILKSYENNERGL